MTEPRTPTRLRVPDFLLRSISRLSVPLLAASLLAICLPALLSPVLGATGADAAAPAAAPTPALSVTLTAVTPNIAVPSAPITITGRVRNAGLVPVTAPVARALIGQEPLSSRKAVSDWAVSTVERPVTQVARKTIHQSLEPGSVTAFTLTIPAKSINHGGSFAVLPLRIEVDGRTSGEISQSGALHTFLPVLSEIKAYEPVSVAWLVPLTLDPDPALAGTPGPARSAAWAKAIGPGSRLVRLIQGTRKANVTWAIDPAVLGPRQGASAVAAEATPSKTASPDPVVRLTSSLAARLKADASRHTLWSLPYADPDLTALLPVASGNELLRPLITRSSVLDVAVAAARTDIAWPVGGTLTEQTQTRLQHAFEAPGLTAAVTSASTLASSDGAGANASRKTRGGLPLLAYDESLSRTVALTTSKATGALTIQQFLADSLALLGERPGTRDRSVLIAEPRTFAGDPTVLRSLFTAAAKAPWLVPATTGQLLEASEKAAPEADPKSTAGSGSAPAPTSPAAAPASADPLSTGTSPLTSEHLAQVPGTMSSIAGLASILGDGRLFSATWTDAQVQQLSSRWRGHPRGFRSIDTATRAAISNVSRSITVAPSSVNFFADRGVLQVTVVNSLSVPIHDVHLSLTPAQPRLRIEQQPGALKIGARARANVPLQVTSLAAGLVEVETVLSTRNGTPLGKNESVNVRVQPPSTWIYWVLGGLAGLVLVLGTYRSLRRGSTRASRPDPTEPQLHD